jgi:hypothetical protein
VPRDAHEKDGDLEDFLKKEYGEKLIIDGSLNYLISRCLQSLPQSNQPCGATLYGKLDQLHPTAEEILKHIGVQNPTEEAKDKLACLLREASVHLAKKNSSSYMLWNFIEGQIANLKKSDPEKILVILSGHGSGSIGDFLSDSDPQSSLSIPQLATLLDLAYADIKEEKDVRMMKGGKIDILGLDSCLMSMAELAYEVKDRVHFLVGSEGYVQNTGWPYHRIIESLRDNPSPETLAKRIVCKYAQFYQDFEVASASTDISVCDLEPMGDLAVSMKKLTCELTRSLKNHVVATELEALLERSMDEETREMAGLRTEITNRGLTEEEIESLSAKLEELRGHRIEKALEENKKRIKKQIADVTSHLAEMYSSSGLEKLWGKEAHNLLRSAMKKLADLNPLENDEEEKVNEELEAVRAKDIGATTRAQRRNLERTMSNLRFLALATIRFEELIKLSAQEDTRPSTPFLEQYVFNNGKAICQALKNSFLLSELIDESAAEENDAVARKQLDTLVGYDLRRVKDPATVNALIEFRLEVISDAFSSREIWVCLKKLGVDGKVIERFKKGIQKLIVLMRQKELISHFRSHPIDDNKKKTWSQSEQATVIAHWRAQSYKGEMYVDLCDFCDQLIKAIEGIDSAEEIRDACWQINQYIGKIVKKSCYVGLDFQHSHGLSVYFPWAAADYWHEYENLKFAKETGWAEFLKAFLRATRRERREDKKSDDKIRRYGTLKSDPLFKAGTEERLKGGTEERLKAGTEERLKAGTEERLKAGTEERLKGKLLASSMKNPPDGFYRCACPCEETEPESRS